MMRSLYLILLLIFNISLLNAQTSVNDASISSYPAGKTQLGWYYGDFIHSGSLIFDITHRWKGKHALGFSLGFLKDINSSNTAKDEKFLSGIDYRLFHKIYLMRTYEGKFIYFRHGLRAKKASFTYSINDFFEFQEYGNTFLRKETRQFEEDVLQTAYEIVFGGEIYSKIFFLDYYVGAGYYKAYNEFYSAKREMEVSRRDPRRSGAGFLLGFRTGIYLN